MDKGRRAGRGQPMWIKFKFYNIIIKSANLDKGGGGETLINKMWMKRHVFLNPTLTNNDNHQTRLFHELQEFSAIFFITTTLLVT